MIYNYYAPGASQIMRFYIPDGVTTIKGVIICGNGYNSDSRTFACEPGNPSQYPGFSEYAKNIGFALIGTVSFGGASEIISGQGQVILNGLASVAVTSRHPELANAPICFFGLSNGGQMAYGFNSWKPSRVIAYCVTKGGYYSPAVLSEVARKTPAIFNSGELDETYRITGINKIFTDNRNMNALISYFNEQGKKHELGNTNAINIKFFDECIKMRYPENTTPLNGIVTLKNVPENQGWLADISTWKNNMTYIDTISSYQSTTTNASWLINKHIAYLYRGIATYNNPLKLSIVNGDITINAGTQIKLAIDTTAFANWNKIEIYDGATKLGELAPRTKEFSYTPTVGVYSITALGYKGSTIRTAIPLYFVVSDVPNKISDIKDHVDFDIYPNPASAYLKVNTNNFEQKKINVIDIYGRTLQTITFNKPVCELDVTNLSKGVYFIQLTYKNLQKMQKIIKE